MCLFGMIDAIADCFKLFISCVCFLLIGGPVLIISGAVLLSKSDEDDTNSPKPTGISTVNFGHEGINRHKAGIIMIVVGCVLLVLEIIVCTALICYCVRRRRRNEKPQTTAPCEPQGTGEAGQDVGYAGYTSGNNTHSPMYGYGYGQPPQQNQGYGYGQPPPQNQGYGHTPQGQGYGYGQPPPPQGNVYAQPLGESSYGQNYVYQSRNTDK